jgi:hypothetical protein
MECRLGVGIAVDRGRRSLPCLWPWAHQTTNQSLFVTFHQTSSPYGCLRNRDWWSDLAGNLSARDRGRCLGCRLPGSGCFARLQVGDALFAGCNHELRTRQSGTGATLAPAGIAGGAERMATLRAYHRFSVRHARGSVAVRQQLTAVTSCGSFSADESPGFPVGETQVRLESG